MRKILVRQLSNEDLLRLLGLNEDDVIISIYKYELIGHFSGWHIEYSTKVVEKKKETKVK